VKEDSYDSVHLVFEMVYATRGLGQLMIDLHRAFPQPRLCHCCSSRNRGRTIFWHERTSG